MVAVVCEKSLLPVGRWKIKAFPTKLLPFLNQARAWFLKVDPVQIVDMRFRVCMCVCVYVCVCVCVCARARVCPRPRLLITSGVIWHNMNIIRLVKQVLQLLYDNSV